ncbi:uncharacterized protein EDB91DRAFT_471235 [Suillus paluster]|uniref:uncharacterized protein n=1 Tax=Suillus paluster TaxID=48578 RepID=UPI001B87540B|nr:uncharacterized protein EDB91DRAFT_245659 [Suillus paluster]XP_041176127.1 uncharacterized protein EDB91DRAFT_471235 [Suillus paluster]KAG1721511.1 hypothetical protein EDB91DRAFT_245659 [Suillus paluster]KAG1737849.1 hypothetical protein EDB91DRAFT_471235 [Suillus paluster]
MFIRFTPVVCAILALAGVTTASTDSACQKGATLECCKTAGDTNSGWQGSDCTEVSSTSKCDSKHTALCCYDIKGSSAGTCYEASS